MLLGPSKERINIPFISWRDHASMAKGTHRLFPAVIVLLGDEGVGHAR